MTDDTLARGVSVANPMDMLSKLVDAGHKPEEMKAWLDMSERWQANRAAEEFAQAITAFQREMPQVEKLKPGADGKYMFAPYEHIMSIAGPIMVRHGIVATFTTETVESKSGHPVLRTTCRVRVGTHTELTVLDLESSPGTKLQNAEQAKGKTLQYAKRYALCAALNIVCRDEDTDADNPLDTLIAAEVEELRELIDHKAVDSEDGRRAAYAAFYCFAKEKCKVPIADLYDIPRKHFAAIKDAVKKMRPKPGSRDAKEGAR